MKSSSQVIEDGAVDVGDVLSQIIETSGVNDEHDTTMINASDVSADSDSDVAERQKNELTDLVGAAERKKQANETTHQSTNQQTNQTSSISSNQNQADSQAPLLPTATSSFSTQQPTDANVSQQSGKVSQQSGKVSQQSGKVSQQSNVSIDGDDSNADGYSVHSPKHQNLRMVSSYF